MSQSRSARQANSFRNRPRKISEADRRNRRLFLEPLEQRALLTVVGVADGYTAIEDTPLFISAEGLPDEQPGTWLELPGVLYNDIGTSLTAALLTGPQYGEVTLYPDGSFEYIPLGNSNLTDSFTYQATGGVDVSDPVTVQIEITPVNDPPLAIADTYTTSKNGQLTVAAAGVLLNDVEPDDELLSATLGTPPEHGTLTFNGDGSFTFTPEADYFGSDSFTYLASDGTLTNETTVSLTIVDLPPEVPTKAFTAQENSPLTVAAEDGLLAGVTDPDNPGVTFVAVLTGNAAHGTAEVDPDGSFTYTPVSNYSGPDEFVVLVAPNGGGEAAVVVVGINVLQNNQAPVAGNDQFIVAEDQVLNGNVLSNDTDPDSTGSLSAVLVAGPGPESGTLTLNANGTFSFTPLLNFFGTVFFTYKLVDGNVPPPPENLPLGFTVSDFNAVFLDPNGSASSPPESDVATVAIDVTPVNDVPVSPDLDLSVPEDSQLVEIGDLLSDVVDPDNDPSSLTTMLVAWPTHGTISISYGGSIVYTPYPGITGGDEFKFIIGDGEGWSEPVTGNITIEEGNDPPVAVDDVFSMPEDPLSFADTVLGNDSDNDGPSLTTSLVSGVAHGSLILQSDGSFIYTPDANYNGADGFSYALSDGEFTVTASVTLNISPVSDAPVAGDDNFSTDEEVPVSGSLTENDVDFDNEPLIVVSPITNPTKGTVSINYDGTFNYTPNANEFGSDSFSYVVYDSYYTTSNVATVNITINPINDAPTASDQSFSLDEDTSLSISESALLTGATDPEGDLISVVIIDQPLYGTLTGNTSAGYVYTPIANYNGPDSFTYSVSDGTTSALQLTTASLIITSVEDPSFSISGGNSVAEPSVTGETSLLSFLITYYDPFGVGGSVHWRTDFAEPETATDEDFVYGEGILNFLPGGGSQEVQVAILYDQFAESDESLQLVLFNPSTGTTIEGANSAEGTIIDTPYEPPFTGEIDVSAPAEVDEGSPLILRGTVIVSTGELPAYISVANGSSETLGTAAVDPITGAFEFVYTFDDDLDDGDADISVDDVELSITATASGITLEKSVTVSVHNLAPTVELGIADETTAPIDAIGDGGTVLLVINSITDSGTESGNYSLHIDWDDGTTEVAYFPTNSTWPQYIEHEYEPRPDDPEPSHTYQIQVSVGDDDNGSSSIMTALLAVKGEASEKPEVSISGATAAASEVHQKTTTFTVTRDVAGPALAVKVVPTHGNSPLASSGDYVLTDSNGRLVASGFGYFSVTIPKDELATTITLTPKLDGLKEGTESLSLTVSSYVNASATPYDIAEGASSTSLSIEDGWGTVTFTTIEDEVEEDANVGWFRNYNAIVVKVQFWGQYTGSLPLAYSGDATTDDYTAPSAVHLSPNGSSLSVGYINIYPTADLRAEPSEIVSVSLGANASANGFPVTAESVAPQGSGTESEVSQGSGTITDDDSGRSLKLYYVGDISHTTREYQEGDSPWIEVTRDKSIVLPQTVWLNFSGTAMHGRDYALSQYNSYGSGFNYASAVAARKVTFSAGSASVRLPIITFRRDQVMEGMEELILAVTPEPGEASSVSHTMQIVANDSLASPWSLRRSADLPAPSYTDWTYNSVGKYWVRLKTDYDLIPDGSPLSLGLKAGDDLPPGLSASYTVSHQTTVALGFGAGTNITGGTDVQFSLQTQNSGPLVLPKDGFEVPPGKMLHIRYLKRQVFFFEQRVDSQDGMDTPASGASGDNAIPYEREVFGWTLFGRIMFDGGDYELWWTDSQ